MGACQVVQVVLRCDGNFDTASNGSNQNGHFERVSEPIRTKKSNEPKSGLLFSYDRPEFIKWLRHRIQQEVDLLQFHTQQEEFRRLNTGNSFNLEKIESYHSRAGSIFTTPKSSEPSMHLQKISLVKPARQSKATGLTSEVVREILQEAFLQFRGTILPEQSLNYLEERVFQDSFTISPQLAATTIVKLLDESTAIDFFSKMSRAGPFDAAQDSHRLPGELEADRKE